MRNASGKKLNKIAIVGMLAFLSACGSASDPLADNSDNDSPNLKQAPTAIETGNHDGVTVSNVYSKPSELGAGDLMFFDLSQSASLDFKGVAKGSEFIFTMANTGYDKGNLDVSIRSDLASADLSIGKETDAVLAESPEDSVASLFHNLMREGEEETKDWSAPVSGYKASFSAGKGISANASVGDSEKFRVLSSFSSLTKYVEISATAECVGKNVIFYVDDRVSEGNLSKEDVAKLCADFDATVADEIAMFGDFSDINNDGKFAVVMTPQVNALGSLGGGIITGFFNSRDLYPVSSTNPASNAMEVIYTLVPDPDGKYGSVVSNNFAMKNLLPSVLPHELQHAISYNQHVFVNGGKTEEAWLNEALSHLAEDLLGEGQENPSRYAIFLQNPHTYSLVTASQPGLGNRGGAFLFVRFLYEQAKSGPTFLKALLNTAQTGVANLENAFNGSERDFDQFGEFFLRWTVALGLTDEGVTKDPRFVYQPRVKHPKTGNWMGVCLTCTAEDNRNTVLHGVSVSPFRGYQEVATLPSAARYSMLNDGDVRESLDVSHGKGEGYGVLVRTK